MLPASSSDIFTVAFAATTLAGTFRRLAGFGILLAPLVNALARGSLYSGKLVMESASSFFVRPPLPSVSTAA